MLKNHQIYFHVFCQIFNQLYDLYANSMNFFSLIFTVLFISSSDRVSWSRAVSTESYEVMFLPRNLLLQCTSLLSLKTVLCAARRSWLFHVEEFFLLVNCINSKILSSVLTIHLLRQFVKEVFFFHGNKKESYALAITKAIDKEIDFSDDS